MAMQAYSTVSRYSLSDNGLTAERKPIESARYISYTVGAGETIESIASRSLGDPLLYWEIMDINPQIKFPLDLKAGEVLRLPR